MDVEKTVDYNLSALSPIKKIRTQNFALENDDNTSVHLASGRENDDLSVKF